jgi:hypothetical protein
MKTRFGAKDSLITNELVSAHQADSGKSRFDFVPLKGQNMANAKSLRKRIALVAAAALGVGLLAAAPAFAAPAAYTASYGTITASPTVNSPVTVPMQLLSAASTAATVGTYTATLTTIPGASALTASSPVANVTGQASDWATAGASTTQVTASTNTLVATGGASAVAVVSASLAGNFTFTPDVPGTYVVTVAFTAGTGSPTSNALGVSSNIVAALSGAKFMTTGNTPPPVAQTVTSGSALSAVTGGFATFSLVQGGTGTQTYNVTVTGGTIGVVTKAGGPVTFINGTNYSSGASWAPTAVTDTLLVQVLNSGSSTSTISVQPVTVSNGVPGTAITGTVTWIGTGSTVISVSNTLIYKGVGTTLASSGTDAAAITFAMAAQTAAANAAANIVVAPKDANGSALASETITAVLTGPGMLGIANGQTSTAAGRALTGTAGQYNINVFGDGTAGVATITISDGTVVLGTKSVTFVGALAKYTTASTAKTDLGVGETEALTYTGLDAAGNAATLGTLYVSSSATTVATVTVSGGVVTITGVVPGTANITIGNAATSPTISTVVAVTVTKTTAKTVTMSFDKASYAVGAPMILTVKAVDSNGAAVADGTRTLFSAAGVTSNVALSGVSLPGSTVTLVGGVATYALYAPFVGGTVTLTGTEGAGTDNVIAAGTAATITASATVTGGTTGGGLSAADSAAIAAAKAAADAATAAVATLSTTVASLIASITAQIRALAAQIAKLLGKSGGTTPGLPKTGSKK